MECLYRTYEGEDRSSDVAKTLKAYIEVFNEEATGRQKMSEVIKSCMVKEAKAKDEAKDEDRKIKVSISFNPLADLTMMEMMAANRTDQMGDGLPTVIEFRRAVLLALARQGGNLAESGAPRDELARVVERDLKHLTRQK